MVAKAGEQTGLSAEERIALVRGLYESTIDHDLATQVYADDLIWHAPRGRGKLMGDHFGADYIIQAFSDVLSISSDFSSEIGEVLASDGDEFVLSFNRDFGTRDSDGEKFSFDVAIRWRIIDGKIAEMWEYIKDEAHKGEFF